MKIGIVNWMIGYGPFYLNLASYLEKNYGDNIIFLNSEKYFKNISEKYFPENNFKFEKYDEINENEIIQRYKKNDDIVKAMNQVYKYKNINNLIKYLNLSYTKSYNYFLKNKFDAILIYNGSTYVEKDVLSDLKIKTFYFENGYFKGTIQLNESGCNAKANFNNFKLEEFYNFKFKTRKKDLKQIDKNNFKINNKIKINYVKYFFSRIVNFEDYFKLIPQVNMFLSVKLNKFIWKQKQNNLNNKLDLNKIKKFIFVPLQVNTDTQRILNSNFKDSEDIINFLLNPILKSTDYKIIFKTHPNEREKKNYEKYVDNKRIFLTENNDLFELIDKSEFVICINSSVGLESLEKGKKVIILGDAFYKNAKYIYPVNSQKNLIPVIKKIENIKIDNKEIKKYINHFKNEIFIKGDYFNIDSNMLELISQRITK